MSERDLFIAALQIAEPAERSAWLDRECGDDALLRQRLDQLLDAFEKAGSLLDSPFAADAPTRQQPIAERRGDVVGPYKLLEQIGEGGFGVVFLAEQSAPVRRKVALKILKAGMETRQVVARFEAERQALAIMDHPNIARVFDGGATSAGRPYFVMEYVKGVPVTEYCDQHRLTPAQRLDLFVVVCQAVQHAHQKGIIHRDLKPSNILVSLHDTVPVVKVIDFGVAKALGQALTDNTLFTGAAQMIGTPLYMSPEQAGMSDLDVDTRSDVYSLGVLLYELLTGATPFTRERFKQAAYDEIRRIIREEDPPKPSTRLSDSTESLPSISAQRHTEPAKLTKLVRGDLDWIVMKALEKDRNRRYETADAFAADVQRFLADEPVLARPPSMGYRIRKFVRRNKGPVLAAALVILSLVGGIVGTARQAHLADEARRSESMRADSENRAKEEAEASEAEIKAVLDFVETKIFSAARPENLDGGLGREVTLRRALEAALPFVEKSFKDRPLIEARLRLTLGSSFWYLGEEKVAAEQEEIARDLYATHLGPDHDKTLIAANNLAVSYATLGRIAEAAKLREETLALRESRFGRDHPETLACMNNLADSYGALARHADAVRLREKALALRKAKLGAEHADTLRSMNDLALSLYRVGKKTEALKLGQEALALRSASLGADHPDTLVTMGVLSVIYAEQGRRSAALDLRERLLALQKTILGPDHRDTLVSMGNLANLYAADGRHDDAIRLHQETIAVRKRKYGADHPSTLTLMYNLANKYANIGKHEAAIKLREATIPLQQAKLGADHPETLKSMNNLATNYAAVGRHAEALKYRKDTLRLREARLGADHLDTVRSMAALARTFANCPEQKLRDPAKAVELAKRAVERAPKESVGWNALGMARYRTGEWKEALAALRKSMELGDGGSTSDFFFTAMAHWKLGDKAEARRWYDRGVESMAKNNVEDAERPRYRDETAKLLEIDKKPN